MPIAQERKACWPRNPHSTRKTGAGLGLYLVAGLVGQWRGSIRYRPDDRHVRFELDLPSM